MSARASRGFTLIEVLVALAVVALALLGLTRVAALQAADADALRQRTLAGWVAANVLAETRLAAGFPATGRSDGRVELGARRWRWTRDVGATPDPQIRRVDITVSSDDGAHEPIVSLSGFAQTAVSP
ncbi:MAG TPA: type II secretion system minor pseudopilin GspI [Rhodanobacteraceae bacterium]|nr:type II secretion system minor pseudopilin GspI [Rhodanobacteraceae bacterium]